MKGETKSILEQPEMYTCMCARTHTQTTAAPHESVQRKEQSLPYLTSSGSTGMPSIH